MLLDNGNRFREWAIASTSTYFVWGKPDVAVYLFYFLFAFIKCYPLLCGTHLNNNIMDTTKLQKHAIAYLLGVSLSDINSTEIDIENDIVIVHYTARYYNSPIKLRKVLSYMDMCDTVTVHGRSLIN